MGDEVRAVVQAAMNDLKAADSTAIDPGDAEPVDTLVASVDAVDTSDADPDPDPSPEPAAAVAEPEPAAEPVKAVAETPVIAPPADEETDLKAIEAELVAKTPGLAKGKISQIRHQAVVTRIRREADKKLAETLEKFKAFDSPDASRRLGLMSAAEDRPKDFFHGVLLKDPIYQQIIKDYIAEQGPAAPAPAAPKAPEPVLAAPEPDEVRADGTLGYSAEGYRQLARYEAAQLTKALQDKVAELEKSVNPVLEERTRTAEFQQVKAKQKTAWDDAVAKWDGFKDYQQEVADYLLAPGNEHVKLDEAHRAVVLPKLKTDKVALEAELRKKWEAELAKTPAVPPSRLSANGQATVAGGDGKVVRSTEDIVREQYRKLAAKSAA